jgi:hypothetical protein
MAAVDWVIGQDTYVVHNDHVVARVGATFNNYTKLSNIIPKRWILIILERCSYMYDKDREYYGQSMDTTIQRRHCNGQDTKNKDKVIE